jgi:hypothetical protein
MAIVPSDSTLLQVKLCRQLTYESTNFLLSVRMRVCVCECVCKCICAIARTRACVCVCVCVLGVTRRDELPSNKDS